MFDDRNTKEEILEGGMKLYEQLAEALVEIERLKADVAAARDEIELWKDRCAAERHDHEATIAEFERDRDWR